MWTLLALLACQHEPADSEATEPAPGDTPAVDSAPPVDTGEDTGADTSGPPTMVWLEGGPNASAAWVSIHDVDGDGASELAVGGSHESWVLSAPWADGPLSDRADWIGSGGAFVELLPDVTGDGVGDLVVNSEMSQTSGPDVYAGPLLSWTADEPFATFGNFDRGWTTNLCGDVDGDGDQDLCVGTHPTRTELEHPATATVFALPLDPAALWTDDALVRFTVGYWDLATGAVDLDGDGRDEIVVSSPESEGDDGIVWLVRDPPLGDFALDQADAIWEGTERGRAGSSLARGDLDGDGREDLVIGASYYQDLPGAYTGRAWIATDDLGGPLGDMAITLVAAQVGGQFAEAMAVGDLDGDGADDLAISEIRGTGDSGLVAIHLGPIPSGTRTLADAALVIEGWGPDDSYGSDVAIGDLDGDGRDDLAVGGVGDRSGLERPGAVQLLFGAALFP